MFKFCYLLEILEPLYNPENTEIGVLENLTVINLNYFVQIWSMTIMPRNN